MNNIVYVRIEDQSFFYFITKDHHMIQKQLVEF